MKPIPRQIEKITKEKGTLELTFISFEAYNISDMIYPLIISGQTENIHPVLRYYINLGYIKKVSDLRSLIFKYKEDEYPIKINDWIVSISGSKYSVVSNTEFCKFYSMLKKFL